MTQLDFLLLKENLIFVGSVDTSKTHLTTALALKARQGRFYTAASMANILLKRNNKGTLKGFMTSLKSRIGCGR